MIDNALAPFKRRVRTMIMRAVVEMVNESGKTQLLQVSRTEDLLDDEVERFQQFGFSSVPLKDAEAIVLLLGGSADHPVITNVDDKRFRPTSLAEGETCLYVVQNNAGVIRVWCKNNGDVLLGTNPTQKLSRADRVDARLDNIESFLGSHTHSAGTYKDSTNATVTGSSGTATDAPSGESTGADEVYGT